MQYTNVVNSPTPKLTKKTFGFSSLRQWILIVLLSMLAAYIVNPESFSTTSYNWMLEDDPASTIVGWEFFKVSPSTEPITKIARYLPESNTTMIQADAIPWLSVFFKFLFRQMSLPATWHFYGLWLVACWILQGIFSAKIADEVGLSPAGKWFLIGTLLFSPSLMARFGHTSLMAHWMILACIYEIILSLKSSPVNTARFFRCLVIPIFAIGVHPYLFAIVTPLLWFSLITANSRWLIKSTYTILLVALSAWALRMLGFAAVKGPVGGEFGSCNLDALSFFNSFGKSLFVPKIKAFWCQPEGFAYPGLAFVILFFMLFKQFKSFILKMWGQNISKALLVIILLYIVYAVASPLRFGGNPILYFPWFSWIEPLPSIFRASGRWVWPAYYLFFVVLVILLDRHFFRLGIWSLPWVGSRLKPLNLRSVVFTAIFAFQFVELSPNFALLRPKSFAYRMTDIENIAAKIPQFHGTDRQVEPEVLFKPSVVSVFCGFKKGEWLMNEWTVVMIALAQKGWTVHSAIGARIDQGMIQKCLDENGESTTDLAKPDGTNGPNGPNSSNSKSVPVPSSDNPLIFKSEQLGIPPESIEILPHVYWRANSGVKSGL